MSAPLFNLRDYRYEPRPIRFLGADREIAGWRVKRYAITVAGRGGEIPDAAAEAAWRHGAVALPTPVGAAGSHGAAILTMHMGLEGFWVLVDWWAHGDILMHRHLRAAVDQPEKLQDAAPEGFGPCVWELAVQAHERDVWLRHVLINRAGPDMAAYLADGLTVLI